MLIMWLVFGDHLLPDAEGGRVKGVLYDLGARLGRPAMLAGLALLATLIGGITPRLPVRWIRSGPVYLCPRGDLNPHPLSGD